MTRDQINIRCEKEMKRYLEDLDIDYSKYVRDLINKDRIEKRDPELIKNQIKNKKDEIKQLEDLLVSPHPMMNQVMELLGKHAKGFKENAGHRTVEQRHRFIKDMILPEIKKYGFNKTVDEIEQLLLSFPDEHNGNNVGEVSG